jgi:membrane associated rhomboid family serine protease
MLPIRDTIRSYTFPVITWLIIGINTVVFFFELNLPDAQLNRFIQIFALTPANLHLNAPWLLMNNPLPLITLVTHMFLHGGWFHFLSNMWILFIFGDNVEDRMGSGRYLVFYTLGGIAAGIIQALISPYSEVPALGAAGRLLLFWEPIFCSTPGRGLPRLFAGIYSLVCRNPGSGVPGILVCLTALLRCCFFRHG